jgi:hypothetical protein
MTLTLTVGTTIYHWALVRQDDRVAPREQVILGTKSEISTGKGGYAACYSFNYEGRKYSGDENHHSRLSSSDTVAVYFDPDDPTTNSLTEFRVKSGRDHGTMISFGFASVGFAVILALFLAIKRSKEKQE